MLAYLTEISKYIILILMIFYTVDAFLAVFLKKPSNMLFVRQEICLFLIQFLFYIHTEHIYINSNYNQPRLDA